MDCIGYICWTDNPGPQQQRLMYVICNVYNQLLHNQGHIRVVLSPLVHILKMPLHILGSNGFGASER